MPFPGRETVSTSAGSNEEVFLWLLLKTLLQESVSKKGVLDAQGKLSYSLDVHIK